ncbi:PENTATRICOPEPTIDE REPEAT-CONTAINING PROTEIN [Salix purpurea]|uniref:PENTATRICOPEPTIDE REPEAT-CONTAINING PROTEIN n=1 Tax=Salix purpurea TaxID=77065 RepID=A0A9Q0VWL6_SALPP|nr:PENTATRICOPEPTIDE REPEAT-CONTAINING PROTEIN [Salix purpurea]
MSFTLHRYMGTSGKGARFEEALKLFKQIPERNVVSWNMMIGGFSQMGPNEEAVNLFVEMIREGSEPSQFALPCSTTVLLPIKQKALKDLMAAAVIKEAKPISSASEIEFAKPKGESSLGMRAVNLHRLGEERTL